MFDNLILDDETIRERILDRYDRYDIIDKLGLSGADILDMFWDRLDAEEFIDVLPELGEDYEA